MKKSCLLGAVSAILFTVITQSSHASILGHDLQIHGSWSTPDERVFSPQVFTVVAGPENISDFAWSVNLDVSTDNLRFEFPGDVNFGGAINGFNGWVITDVNSSVLDMIGVSLNSDTSMQLLKGGPFDVSHIGFDADRITINLDGMFINAGSILSLDVEFTNAVPEPYVEFTNAVPEPSVLALLGLGLAGISFTRRKMKA